jgi:hypothetical protein
MIPARRPAARSPIRISSWFSLKLWYQAPVELARAYG